MTTKLQFNVEPLLLRLQSENRRRYTYTEVANAIGVKRQSIERLSRNDSFQDLLLLRSGILDFVSAEGMPITIDQLFTVQEEGSQAENLDSQPL
mgnify:FL=1